MQGDKNVGEQTLVHFGLHASYVEHGVVAVGTNDSFGGNDTPSSTLEQLPSYFGANSLVASHQQQIEQSFPLIFGDVVAVALRKSQQTLMPEHRQLLVLGAGNAGHVVVVAPSSDGIAGSETHEMENKRIDDLVGQSILLLQQHTDEDVCSTSSLGVDAHLLGGNLT